jgi:hypothetical protein
MTNNAVRGSAGGTARDEILPPKRLMEIVRKAAHHTVGISAASVLHKGNFKDDFDRALHEGR